METADQVRRAASGEMIWTECVCLSAKRASVWLIGDWIEDAVVSPLCALREARLRGDVSSA